MSGGHDPLACRRVVAGDRACEAFVLGERRGDSPQPFDRLDIGPALRHRVESARIGKRVEVDRPGVAASSQRDQKLDGLDRVHHTRHQAVVALPVPVVELDAEQPRVAIHQDRGVRRHLPGVEDVRKVQGDSQVRRSDLPDGEQGRARIRHQGVGPGLVRFVLERDVDCPIVSGEHVEGRNRVIPHPPVVGLEGIVEAVLAEPQGHQRSAHLRECVETAPGEVDGLPAPGRIGIGQGAEPEVGVRVVAHRKAVQLDAESVENGGKLPRRRVVEVIGVVEIRGIETVHRRRTL